MKNKNDLTTVTSSENKGNKGDRLLWFLFGLIFLGIGLGLTSILVLRFDEFTTIEELEYRLGLSNTLYLILTGLFSAYTASVLTYRSNRSKR